jgi:precorrin-2 dehydrogenase / sirohydrochlorin ferrochelatase
MSARYPIFLDLGHKPVLIVGGGALALQKLRTLVPTGADVTVVAPELRGSWPTSEDATRFRLVLRPYETRDLTGQQLVFAATDDPDLNHRIVAQARVQRILANAVDDPAWCDFYTPAVLRRGQITVAVSTGGGFPGVTRALREVLEEWLPEGDDGLIGKLFALRAALRNSGRSPAERSAALHKLIDGFKAEYLRPTQREHEAKPTRATTQDLPTFPPTSTALMALHG